MEALSDEVLLPWLLATFVRAARGRDRDANRTGDLIGAAPSLLPVACAVTGEALLQTSVTTYERLAKGLLNWNGRALSSLDAEESELYLAAKARIERQLRRFSLKHPGTLVFNVTCGKDDESVAKKWFIPESIRLTVHGLDVMEAELEALGGKWLRLAQTDPNAAPVVGRD